MNKFLLLLIGLISLSTTNSDIVKNGDELVINIVISKQTFKNFEVNDEYESMLSWTNEYLRTRKIFVENNIKLKWNILDDNFTIARESNNSKFDFLGVKAADYFIAGLENTFLPGLASRLDQSDKVIYLLVKNRNTEGTKLILEKQNTSELGYMWLNLTLMREQKQPLNKYFTNIEFADNESKSLLSVFFKNNNYALITQKTYEIMTELNPQIKTNIEIVYRSPEFIYGILAYYKNIENFKKEVIFKEAMSIGNETNGKQILSLFKLDGLTEVDIASLMNVKQFITDYKKTFKSFN